MDDALRQRFKVFLESDGFDKVLSRVEILEVAGGRSRLRLSVERSLQNIGNNLHGGASATLVDYAGTLAIMSADKEGRPGVTTDLNVSYLSAGRPGESVLVEAHCLKAGRTLAYVSVDLLREQDGVRIAQGRMTKFMG